MLLRIVSPLLVLAFPAAVAMAHPGPAGHDHGDDDDSASGHGSEVRITVRGGYRYIEANGLPDHATGRFPNRGNPNAIRSQRYSYRVPAEPKQAERVTPLVRQPFGVALNGVVFDPGTAEFWRGDPRSGWNYDALSGKIDLGLDSNHAHVQPSGAYHYHGVPTGLIEKLGGNDDKMLLLGYAADGFPIYAPRAYRDAKDADSGLTEMDSSYRLKQGTRPARPRGPGGRFDGTFVQDWEYVSGSGDLDECNGRFGVTPEYPDGTYYYVLTNNYPFIPRSFRGKPDPSFERRGPGGFGPAGAGGPPGFGPGGAGGPPAFRPRGPGGPAGFGPRGSRPRGFGPPGPPPPRRRRPPPQ